MTSRICPFKTLAFLSFYVKVALQFSKDVPLYPGELKVQFSFIINVFFYFIPGFFNQYHKKEYHKLLNFFGNEHVGGEYIKYGNQQAKESSESEAGENGEHGKVVSEKSVEAVKHP